MDFRAIALHLIYLERDAQLHNAYSRKRKYALPNRRIGT